ncbi:MAG TPA: malto-oligosyltrehalose trehalohydrolase, partial [Terriglobales bacterium]
MRGAQYLGNGRTRFEIWAPKRQQLKLHLTRRHQETDIPMQREANGVFHLDAEAAPGDKYAYRIDDMILPDPVSRLLPEGVHGPTQIVSSDSDWTDQHWKGIPFRDYIIYELHVGTFTPEGTFDGVISKLPYLRDLGVTAIELMPVAAFPGRWNWGYDGINPYSVFAGYGGPEALKRLVNAAHEIGLAVIQDVVYNHLGPEGNYTSFFAPYFSPKHKTPWGDGINFDDTDSREVRDYFIENALYWGREYHMDGLRLDAIQSIKDDSPLHIVAEINRMVKDFATQSGREIAVIAETDENDAKQVRDTAQGGWGLDAVWSDDFHHSLYRLLTGEKRGYYKSFGSLDHVERALREGFVYQGEHFTFWDKPRGTKPEGVSLPSHVVCIENHDQVGNRALGERITELTDENNRRLAAALVCLSPQTPMLFMGQEHDESNRFMFFTDFGDQPLAEAVRKGRREEFP